jgi:hypothetical protein
MVSGPGPIARFSFVNTPGAVSTFHIFRGIYAICICPISLVIDSQTVTGMSLDVLLVDTNPPLCAATHTLVPLMAGLPDPSLTITRIAEVSALALEIEVGKADTVTVHPTPMPDPELEVDPVGEVQEKNPAVKPIRNSTTITLK